MSNKEIKNLFCVQLASVSALPFWTPAFFRSLRQKVDMPISSKVDSLSHTNYFKYPKNYFRGLKATAMIQWLYPTIFFLNRQILKNLPNNKNVYVKYCSIFTASCSTAFIANPLEVVVINMQQNRIKSLMSYIDISVTHGFRGFFTGLTPMLLRNGVFGTSLFVAQPHMKFYTDKYFNLDSGSTFINSLGKNFIASIPLALCGCLLTMPLDLAATLRQSDPSRIKFKSGYHALKQVYQRHGYASIFGGFRLRCVATTIELSLFNVFFKYYKENLI